MTPEDWRALRSTRGADWPVEALLAAKARTGLRVAVVIPALNEEATVGDVAGTVHRDLVTRHGVVDDLLVLDSGSTDRTAERARAAGARVVTREEALPGVPVRPGKGEVLWRSTAATDADLLVFVDADLRGFTASYVTGLLGPLLHDDAVLLVKGAYDRPLESGTGILPGGGGRVTELVARPLLSLHWPELTVVVQPLAGEWAVRRSHMRSLHVPVGYGVELAALVDTYEQHGLGALAQVDLGTRVHGHQTDPALGRMAAQIWHAAANRLPSVAIDEPARDAAVLRTWRRTEGDPDAEFVEFVTDEAVVDLTEREPMELLDRRSGVPSPGRPAAAP